MASREQLDLLVLLGQMGRLGPLVRLVQLVPLDLPVLVVLKAYLVRRYRVSL
jgi:hypothetical protein